jgi:hypothetical protein
MRMVSISFPFKSESLCSKRDLAWSAPHSIRSYARRERNP